jgi:hypothetical protein
MKQIQKDIENELQEKLSEIRLFDELSKEEKDEAFFALNLTYIFAFGVMP